MHIRRTLAGLAVMAVASGSLAACGSSDDTAAGSSSGSGTATTASPSPSGGSTGGSSSGRLDKAALVEAITEGQIKAGSAHLQMTMGGTTKLSAQGDVSYKSATPTMRMTMSLAQMGAKKIEMRLLGGIIYMSIPQLTPAGKFVKIDPKDTSSPLSKSFGGLSKQFDPLSSARAMKAAVTTVKFVGAEKVDGQPADHYRVGVDTSKMMSATSSPAVAGMPKTLTYDMWLDSKHLLRRMKYKTSGVDLTMTLSKWGEPVSVQAPPASAVVDPAQIGG